MKWLVLAVVIAAVTAEFNEELDDELDRRSPMRPNKMVLGMKRPLNGRRPLLVFRPRTTNIMGSYRFRLSPKRRDDICMGSETSRKLTNAARSCARSSRFGSSYCNNAKATICIYRRMGWIGSRNFRKTNVKKIGADMLNVPAFKQVAGGSNKQVADCARVAQRQSKRLGRQYSRSCNRRRRRRRRPRRPQVLPRPPRRWRPRRGRGRRPRRMLPFRIPFLPFLRSDMPAGDNQEEDRNDNDDLEEDHDDLDNLEEDHDDLDEFEEDRDTFDSTDVQDMDEPEDRRSPLRWGWKPPRGASRSEMRLGMVMSFNRCLKRKYRRSCDQVINGILNGSGQKCKSKTGGFKPAKLGMGQLQPDSKETKQKTTKKRSKSSKSIKKVLRPLKDLLKV